MDACVLETLYMDAFCEIQSIRRTVCECTTHLFVVSARHEAVLAYHDLYRKSFRWTVCECHIFRWTVCESPTCRWTVCECTTHLLVITGGVRHTFSSSAPDTKQCSRTKICTGNPLDGRMCTGNPLDGHILQNTIY
jgi:hypothetical protein